MTFDLKPHRSAVAGLLVAVLWMVLVGYAALVVRDFYRYVDRAVYVSVDDSLTNEAYVIASKGRYGFLASPVLFGVERHHGEISYGPWYFHLAGALIWLFGYSLTLVRSIHLWTIVAAVAAASWWFRGMAGAPAAVLFGLGVLYSFDVTQWPMARPDSMVSLFAVALVIGAGLGFMRRKARYWFAVGLAASCGAFTHLIAASLVFSSSLLFVLAAVRQWHGSGDRASRWRSLWASAAAFAAGGLLGAVMFYGSFGFRFADQQRLFASYNALVASSESYGTVLMRHFNMAFTYLPPWMQVGVWALLIAAWLFVALSIWMSDAARSMVVAYLLPPVTVWTGYLISNGWYTNQHKGYAILHEVMACWTLAAITWVGVSVLNLRSPRLARAFALVLCVGVLVQGLRQLDWQLEASGWKSVAAKSQVSAEDYIDQVLGHIPAGSTAWGTVMYGIETPDRIQLVQLAEGLTLMPAVDVTARESVVPDYLLFGYPEGRDNALIVLRGGNSLLGRFDRLVLGAPYRLVSLVAGAPYGITRIYARTAGPDVAAPPLPAVSLYDAKTRQWLSRIDAPLTTSFSATARAEFRIGYQNEPEPALATRTVSANLPPGRYLLRVQVTPGSGPTLRRLLAVGSPRLRRQTIGELGPAGDFASYLDRDTYVIMASLHEGGPLEVSQFDDGPGADIRSVEVFPIGPLLNPDEAPGLTSLPKPSEWEAAAGVHIDALESGTLRVVGDSTRLGYQVLSSPIVTEPRDLVSIHLDMSVSQGRVCPGVLNGPRLKWLVAPDTGRRDWSFRMDETRAFSLVAANCNDAEEGSPRSMFAITGGTYSIERAALYTDRFMAASAPKPVVPELLPGALTSPKDLRAPKALLTLPIETVQPTDVAYQSSITRPSAQGWTADGRAEAPYAYLLKSKPRYFDMNARLIVVGHIDRGGLSVGLLNGDGWAAQVNVTEPGPFTVVIAAPRNSPYSIVVANILQDKQLQTSVTITKLGVVRAF